MNLSCQILPQRTNGGHSQVEQPVKTNEGEQVNRKSGEFPFCLVNLGEGQKIPNMLKKERNFDMV